MNRRQQADGVRARGQRCDQSLGNIERFLAHHRHLLLEFGSVFDNFEEVTEAILDKLDERQKRQKLQQAMEAARQGILLPT